VKVVGDRFIFESDILFGSCSATLGEQGKTELNKLAAALLDIQDDIPAEVNWVLRVDGHATRRRSARPALHSSIPISIFPRSARFPWYSIFIREAFRAGG